MRVPDPLTLAFGAEFENLIADFAAEHHLLPEPQAIHSVRFLARSVVPHVQKLSALFNRENQDQGCALSPYWKESSNPAHLRLAYFLYFMPANLYRLASVWCEMARLGFQWQLSEVKGIEFGAGPASGTCGIGAGAAFAQGATGLPKTGTWALIEQDKAILELGSAWAATYLNYLGIHDWGIRPFHRKLNLEKQGFLPRNAPRFNLWVMSYTLNEFETPPRELAKKLLESWDRHLEEEGVIILVEPALRSQSRRLLELRKELISQQSRQKSKVKPGHIPIQILLPCLGHQACGALANPEDWCHEEVTWWRPPYFRTIDKMASLDRKSLPFSYLVLTKSKRSREEILPQLAKGVDRDRYRLVSPTHKEGQDLEFFVCGQDGKHRARYRPRDSDQAEDLGRGDILLDSKMQLEPHVSRFAKVKAKL